VIWNLQHGTVYYHLWYLLLLPAFYLLLPLLSYAKNNWSHRKFTAVAWISLAFGTAHLVWLTLHGGELWFPLRLVDYLGFILVGATFDEEIQNNTIWSYLRKIATVIIFAVSGWIVSVHLGELQELGTVLANLVTALYPVSIFILFIRFRVQATGLVTKIAKLGLGVYILHPLSRTFLTYITPESFLRETHILIQLILGVIFVFSFSAAITYVMRMNKYTRYFVTMAS